MWPHLREFADRGIAHCKKTLVQLTEAHTPCELYAVHGHYADAGQYSITPSEQYPSVTNLHSHLEGKVLTGQRTP